MTTPQNDYTCRLFDFLNASPTAFHAVSSLKHDLLAAGMTELHESQPWQLKSGGSYFVIRENSALAAFTIGSKETFQDGFKIVASHSDSPGLLLKPRVGVSSSPYLQLGVEIYGGPLLNTWFDRDLSLAGRVTCTDSAGSLIDYLIDFKRPLIFIPSLAIHFDREANNGRPIDKQKFLPPLLSQSIDRQLPEFSRILTNQLQLQYPESDISEPLAFDLFCYDCQPAGHLGLDEEFITSGRLDNQLSCHAAMSAICAAGNTQNSLFLCANHEENGSTSTTGAHGNFIETLFERIVPVAQDRHICLRNSFLISADNAHAVHPNFPEKSDAAHDVCLNGGPVIKINANQRYATNSRSAARYKLLARKAGIPCQEFVMRNDLPCGSTIGPMTAAKMGIETIDIGAPSLGMHSIREITGSNDPFMLYQVILEHLTSNIQQNNVT